MLPFPDQKIHEERLSGAGEGNFHHGLMKDILKTLFGCAGISIRH
jgi:hypothetical protein